METSILTHKDWERLLALAEAGNQMAQYEVAQQYDFGLIIEDEEIVAGNPPMAFKWYYEAYKNGHIEAVTRAADFLSEGIHCKQNIALAIELYQIGIDNGSGISANNLAMIYRDQQDNKKAFELYKIAQELSGTVALYLALCYHFGIGTEKNKKMSFQIFDKISKDATELINSQYEIDEANYFLGKIYLEGEIVTRSVSKARTYLELANTDNDHRSAKELLLIIGETHRITGYKIP